MNRPDTYPLSALRPSPFNPRKRFPEAELRELADSILAVGVLQPILIRPIPPGAQTDIEQRYEIVFGERRYRASLLAGVDFIPAELRELDDRQAAVIQTHENAKRRDVTAFEEADSWAFLMTEFCMTAEEVMTEVGCTKSQLYARLKLHAASPAVRSAFDTMGLPAEIALELARIKNHKVQTQWLPRLRGPNNDGWMSTRDAKAYVRKGCHISILPSPFDHDDKDLCPSAGACASCPKLACNDPELADLPVETCTDKDCYDGKVTAFYARRAVELAEQGHIVVQGDDATRFPTNALVMPAGYVGAAQIFLHDDLRLPLTEWIKRRPDDTPAPQLTYVLDGITPPRTYVRREDVDALFKALRIAKHGPAAGKPDNTVATAAAMPAAPQTDDADDEPHDFMEGWSEVERAAMDAEVFSKARRAVFRSMLTTPRTLEELRAMAYRELQLDEDGDFGVVGDALGIVDVNDGTEGEDDHETSSNWIAKASADQLGALLAALAVNELLHPGTSVHNPHALQRMHERLRVFETYGVDVMSFAAPLAEPASTPSPAAPAVEGCAQRGNDNPFAGMLKSARVAYRNAATGETWSGRGLMPKWLKAATAAGAKLNDFEVKVESKAASGGKAKTKPASPAAAATNGDLFAAEGAAS
jgi:ParB/RepB/Spo0J family partition protein